MINRRIIWAIVGSIFAVVGLMRLESLILLLHHMTVHPDGSLEQFLVNPPGDGQHPHHLLFELKELVDDETAGGPLTLAQRISRSETLWAANVHKRHDRVRAAGGSEHVPLFTPVNRGGHKDIASVWDFFEPAFNCPHEVERVGRIGDGGKWVCGMANYERNRDAPLLIYSFGVERESSFEAEVLNRTNCEIWGYDFSVDGWGPQLDGNPRISFAHFNKIGLGAETVHAGGIQFMSLNDIMHHNHHQYIDILKMDVEAAEFDGIYAFIQACRSNNLNTLPIGQILIELHLTTDTWWRKILTPWRSAPVADLTFAKLLHWWESLEMLGFRAVHNEVNLFPFIWSPKRYVKPRFMEVTFINTDLSFKHVHMTEAYSFDAHPSA